MIKAQQAGGCYIDFSSTISISRNTWKRTLILLLLLFTFIALCITYTQRNENVPCSFLMLNSIQIPRMFKRRLQKLQEGICSFSTIFSSHMLRDITWCEFETHFNLRTLTHQDLSLQLSVCLCLLWKTVIFFIANGLPRINTWHLACRQGRSVTTFIESPHKRW